MSDIAIRFVLDAGNLDFDTEEIFDTKLIFFRSQDVQINQTIDPTMVRKGDLWKGLKITFNEYWKTTRTKVELLISEKLEMTCYYGYLMHLTTKSMDCIYYPVERRRIWFVGERGAKVSHSLSFLQSS